MIYDELVSETSIEPLPAADGTVNTPAVPHDAEACSVCQAWLAHVREAP